VSCVLFVCVLMKVVMKLVVMGLIHAVQVDCPVPVLLSFSFSLPDTQASLLCEIKPMTT